ncbi:MULTISPECIES: RidA family protein [Cellulosimicrobium]|uniref:RidA family protein n=1 Tax=Cellulosimicrobium funkei TaxID=264251 RepID=A0A4Y8QY01_9MICO|nr:MULTISPECIES: RidA family protein [Cellulosimicrobium]TFF05161.1 RidA family protein [Cellulosimicrobium funkei]TGA69556.1 RidA family protein [Cellulosimicrobium terreum]
MATQSVTHLNPPGLHRNPAFSQGTIVETGRTLYVGGQNGTDAAGAIVEGGVAAQTAQALRNVLAVLAEAGAGPQDVARLAVYLDPEADLMEGFGAVGEVWGQHPAAVTVLRVGIARPGALVEIEAVAALPA